MIGATKKIIKNEKYRLMLSYGVSIVFLTKENAMFGMFKNRGTYHRRRYDGDTNEQNIQKWPGLAR